MALTNSSNWVVGIPYVCVNGVWTKAIITEMHSDGWEPRIWMVYDGDIPAYEEKPNDYGTTVILNKYTTEENNLGTSVVFG